MKALITGASSGIGYDMALYLSELGHDLIVVARRKDRLLELKAKAKTSVIIIDMDLSNETNCRKLYEMVKNEKIDILINNAGYGLYGEFYQTDLITELDMIDLNIKTVHILTKLFLIDFRKRNSGYILNVASVAAFAPGPLMATYYGTKAYVLRLSEAIYEELRQDKSGVSISVLCPGPVDTEFNKVAKVKFSMAGLSSSYVAKYGIDRMFKKKLIIIPGTAMKIMRIMSKIIPDKWLARVIYGNKKSSNRI